ncbi:MAG: TylF/MycF family methyltransferase [Myxococcota bacterium]
MRRPSRLLPLAALLLVSGPAAGAGGSEAELARVRGLYLDVMARTLTDLIYENHPQVREQLAGDVSLAEILAGAEYDYPVRAHTMIGLTRLANIRKLVEDVLAKDVPGDLLEAGAWRGGATIYMRAVLAAHDVRDRTVWVADSFEGLPPPDPERYPADAGLDLHENQNLAVSLEEARRNFERYGLLDDQVKFLKGWFKDTFPTAPIEKLAVLRLDGDLYASTMDSLVPLYSKVASGGYVIVDDYKIIPACRKAVDDYRAEHGITAPLVDVDWNAVYWRKP